MIRLFTSYYDTKSPERSAELLLCLCKNIENEYIKEIIVMIEGGVEEPILHEKVSYIRVLSRPTFFHFIKWVNIESSLYDISLISNSDIYFDESIKLLDNLGLTDCYALSRQEISENGRVSFVQRMGWSQDCWAFRGPINKDVIADYPIGIAGADNRFCHDLKEVGYRVSNPSESIICYHVHKGSPLGYANTPKEQKVAPPYLLVPVGTIEQVKANHISIQSRPLSFE